MIWYANAQVMDIAKCNYPLRESPDKPGDKSRPGLVLLVASAENNIVAVYGTSQIPNKIEAWQMLVYPNAKSGLTKTTLFDFSRRQAMPRNKEYFPAHTKSSPKMGILPVENHKETAECMAAALVKKKRHTDRKSGTQPRK